MVWGEHVHAVHVNICVAQLSLQSSEKRTQLLQNSIVV